MSEEESGREGMPLSVIETLFGCMRGVAKMVAESDDVLRGYPGAMNTIVFSLELAEAADRPVEYYHCLFHGRGRHVDVFACWSKQSGPDDCEGFEHLASHENMWFSEGMSRLRETLEGGPNRTVISFESRQFRIKSEDFRQCPQKGAKHRLITRGNIRVMPETEYQTELKAFREACASR